jgi:hypothetical protein
MFFNESTGVQVFGASRHPPSTLAPNTEYRIPNTPGQDVWEASSMEPTNRRDFLKHASATAAVVGVVAAAPLSLVESAAAADTKAPAVPAGARVDRHVVAHLRNVQTGEVAIYTGDREITVNDKRLAALLYKASR